MRRLLATVLFASVMLVNAGCFINIWASDPNERMEELLIWSENYRQIKGEWKRFWFMDQPSHLTPNRIHGGLGV